MLGKYIETVCSSPLGTTCVHYAIHTMHKLLRGNEWQGNSKKLVLLSKRVINELVANREAHAC